MRSTSTNGMAPVRLVLILLGIGAAALVALGGWWWWSFSRPLPSDAALIARFHEHQPELDRLAAMAIADTGLVGIGYDPSTNRRSVYVIDTPLFNRRLTLGEERASGRSELRRLLERAGLPALSRARDGKTVRFVVASRWRVRKGFVYSEKPPAPQRSSLDGIDKVSADSMPTAYVALAPKWFLFLEPRL